jgi:excisionase family DNA binding protein
MKRYVETAIDTLIALDCRLDQKDREVRTDRWRFTHPNAPDEFFTLNLHSSETAARAVVQRARVAAGLATSETGKTRKPKVNQRQKLEREAERQRRDAAHALGEARAAEERTRRVEAQARRNHQELDRLIRGPIASGADAVAVPPEAMLTVEQVADWTGVTDKAVRRALDSGALEGYQCGKDVKVKGADVRRWLA